MENLELFVKSFPDLEFKRNMCLAPFTTFKVGGNAKIAVFPSSKESLKDILNFVKGKLPYCVIGSGSNVLVSDKGFNGVVIFTSKVNSLTLKGNILEADCGVKISRAVKLAKDNNLSGLEFAVGIPGTMGGMVAMNGGCFNKSVSDLVCYVKTEDGVYNKKLCDFFYRSSRFLNGEVVLSVALKLKVSEEDVIEQKTARFTQARSKNQPKGNTCGSVFLNQGYFAGKLIDQAGLKGCAIGKAHVSERHANFIINDGDSADDIYKLINYVKRTVAEKLGVSLNEEVRYIGEF